MKAARTPTDSNPWAQRLGRILITLAVVAAAVMAAASAPVEVAPSKAMSNPEALTQLQSWYNKADAETRKAFQIWVIQQQ